jgi:hypothetical protein
MAHLASNQISSHQQIVTTDQYHYLAAQHQAIAQTKVSYGTAMVVSLELYLPQGSLAPSLSRSNDMIERFLECLQGSIDHAMISRSKLEGHPLHCRVRHACQCIMADDEQPAFEMTLCLNPDAFNGLGLLDMTGRGLMSQIKQAWTKTLGISLSQAAELVRSGVHGVDCR